MKTLLGIVVGLVLILLLTPQLSGADALDYWYLRDSRQFNKVRFVGNLFFALGSNGNLATSEDGTSWIMRNSGTAATLNGVAYSPISPPLLTPTYVVVGSAGTILTSTDGTNWTTVTTTNTCDLNDVARSTTTFVAVTTRAQINQPNALRSSNATNWTAVTFPGGTPSGGAFISSAISYGGGAFIAAGGIPFTYDLWRSTSGSTWTMVADSDQVVGGITYGDGRFFLAGWEGYPRSSTNAGVSWFAVGDTNICNPPPMSFCMAGNDVTYGNSTFIIARGFLHDGILTSTNTSNWAKRTALNGMSIDSVTFGKGTFVAVGPDGVFQSEPISTPMLSINRMQGANTLLIQSSGEVGRGYRLQSSANLTTWSDVVSFTNTLPTMEFVVTPDLSIAAKLYRVVTP